MVSESGQLAPKIKERILKGTAFSRNSAHIMEVLPSKRDGGFVKDFACFSSSIRGCAEAQNYIFCFYQRRKKWSERGKRNIQSETERERERDRDRDRERERYLFNSVCHFSESCSMKNVDMNL